MKNLFYSVRYLLKNKGTSIFKVVSLTLGLMAALVLFSQVAFDMSYDNFYPDKEQIYSITCKWNINGKEADEEGRIINAPFAPTMTEEIPEVVCGTVLTGWVSDSKYQIEEKEVSGKLIVADSLFFQTFSLPIIAGNIADMGKPFHAFVSETFAARAFGKEDPLGKQLKEGDNNFTVAGVFKDIPKNSHLQMDVVVSFNTMYALGASPGWQNNDGYLGYVKLAEGVDPKVVEAKIPEMMRRHFDVEAEIKKGTIREYFLRPMVDIHTKNPQVQKTTLILSLLAFSLLFAAAMNYVLLTVSALPKRAKSIGVHKCNGATSTNILELLVTETSILILIALTFSVLLIFTFREYIEMLIKSDLSAIFNPANLWVSGVVLAVLFITTAFLPSQVLSSIPVTQVFRTYRDSKIKWKNGLLFVQFVGISFMISLLVIIMMQYHMILNKDMGYSTSQIVKSNTTKNMTNEQLETAKTELLRLPFVESVTIASNTPLDGLSGSPVVNTQTKEDLFTGRFMFADADFIKTFHIPLKDGQIFRDTQSENNQEVIVNETFVRMMGLEDPIGKSFDYLNATRTICGVMKDYQGGSVYNEVFPVILMPFQSFNWWEPSLIVKVNTPLTKDITAQLSDQLQSLSKNRESAFTSFKAEYDERYRDARLFRDAVTVASVIMLVISLLGLFGFVEDEIARRTKEIAIRKVNGALVIDILRLLAKGISYIALPAITIGLLISFAVGSEWLQQFALKIPLHIIIFTLNGVAIFGVALFCVIARTMSIATSNPVGYLKME